MDQIEKYIMTRLYKYVFCPETTDDEKKDLAIQKRIRQLVVLLFLVVFRIDPVSIPYYKPNCNSLPKKVFPKRQNLFI